MLLLRRQPRSSSCPSSGWTRIPSGCSVDITGCRRTTWSFDEVDRKLVALELEDFAEAIRSGGEPEVTGRMGLDAVALIYSLLESGHLGQAVSFADVAEDRVNAYQQEINDARGALVALEELAPVRLHRCADAPAAYEG